MKIKHIISIIMMLIIASSTASAAGLISTGYSKPEIYKATFSAPNTDYFIAGTGFPVKIFYNLQGITLPSGYDKAQVQISIENPNYPGTYWSYSPVTIDTGISGQCSDYFSSGSSINCNFMQVWMAVPPSATGVSNLKVTMYVMGYSSTTGETSSNLFSDVKTMVPYGGSILATIPTVTTPTPTSTPGIPSPTIIPPQFSAFFNIITGWLKGLFPWLPFSISGGPVLNVYTGAPVSSAISLTFTAPDTVQSDGFFNTKYGYWGVANSAGTVLFQSATGPQLTTSPYTATASFTPNVAGKYTLFAFIGVRSYTYNIVTNTWSMSDTVESKEAIEVVVTDRPVLTSIVLSPTSMGLQPGQVGTFTVTPKDQFGVTMTGQTIGWSSSAPTVASVVNGVVTANNLGSSIVTVTVGTLSKTATVTVSPTGATVTPPAIGDFMGMLNTWFKSIFSWWPF